MKKQIKRMCSLALSVLIIVICTANALAFSTDDIISSYSVEIDLSSVSGNFLALSGAVSDEQNIIDAAADIAAGVLNFEEKIDISSYKIRRSDSGILFDYVRYEYPELINIPNSAGFGAYTNGYLAYISFTYIFSEDEKDKYFIPFNAAVDEIVNQAQNLSSDFLKALFVHDYLATNSEYATEVYDSDAEKSLFIYSAYGNLVEHRSVCQGYSMAYKLIMKKLSIDVDYAISDEMNHIWNTITIDGNTYHTDVTYDDPTPDKLGYVAHSSFLCTDEEITASGHTGWTTASKISAESYPTRFWDNINSKICITDDEMIYAEYDDGSRYGNLVKRNISTNESQILPSMLSGTHWTTMAGDGYYLNNFSRLELVDNVIYYSMPNGVNAISIYGRGDQNVYTLPDDTAGRIYGFAQRDGKFYGEIASTPNEDGEITELALAEYEPVDVVGDADENGVVNLLDAIIVQKAVIQLIILDGQAKINADYDCDGKITLRDAVMIQKVALNDSNI